MQATAHAIFTNIEKHANAARLTFDTLSGEVAVARDGAMLQLDFPSGEPQQVQANYLPALSAALRIDRARVTSVSLCKKTRKLLVLVDSTQLIESASPNHADLLGLELGDDAAYVKGVILCTGNTAGTGYEQYDFISRYFAPWNGINEDPVTGTSKFTFGYHSAD